MSVMLRCISSCVSQGRIHHERARQKRERNERKTERERGGERAVQDGYITSERETRKKRERNEREEREEREKREEREREIHFKRARKPCVKQFLDSVQARLSHCMDGDRRWSPLGNLCNRKMTVGPVPLLTS